MAMNTERSSKALHNFTMPGQLRWGNQRFLRCMKVNSDEQISPLHRFKTAATDSQYNHHHHHRRSISIQSRRTGIRGEDGREPSCDGSHKVCSTPPPPPPADHEIAAIGEKVLFDLQTAAVKMKDAILKDGLEEREVSILVATPPKAVAELPQGETHMPWSLRTRRAACKTTPSGGGAATGCVSGGGPSPGLQPTRPTAAADNSSRLRSSGGGAEGIERKEREKFSVALSKRAIEEDFVAMVNHRPPRRPKKRPKIIQKQVDMLFPGLWLTEITADMYKVTEPAP